MGIGLARITFNHRVINLFFRRSWYERSEKEYRSYYQYKYDQWNQK